ncbi:unnamed protein product [Echinostoma caproni]|uniref:UDENN domain-containing protein n=1 Tax=Echinostoma caproni TaxID=27848 RepID=A0A183A8C9_9TREM|nr:unnamed protein product [Echinostoma caproni]
MVFVRFRKLCVLLQTQTYLIKARLGDDKNPVIFSHTFEVLFFKIELFQLHLGSLEKKDFLREQFMNHSSPDEAFSQDGGRTQSFPHPFPPETSDGLDQFVSELPKTCPAQRKWPANPVLESEASVEPELRKSNLLSEAADVIISTQQEQHDKAQKTQSPTLRHPWALAPLAQLEHDPDLTLPRTKKLNKQEATTTGMQRASVEADPSMTERPCATVTTKHSQPISPGREKPKILDLRRTTPRQLKQHHHKQGGTDAKVSNSLTNVNEKYKTVPTPDSATKSNPSELASSLIRTASLHLRSTWSKLKRSNSGHSTKSQSNSSTSLRERRCSDPSTRGLPFESEEMGPGKQPNHHHQQYPHAHQQQQNYQHLTKDDDWGKSQVVTVPPRVSSLKGPPPRTTSPSTTPQTRHRVASAPDESPPPPPGCSKWSTRLDPPPPVSNGRPIAHTQGPVVFKHIQRNRSSDLSPSDSDKSKSGGQAISRVEWKPSGHGLGATTFSSLPTGNSDDLNLLSDDCVDVGELGRINFRTGSFMGRYPQSRGGGQTVRYPQITGPVSTQVHHRHVQQASTTPSRLSPSRPLYLSPPYLAQSSGNTTRSAPSPSLSSMTSTSGPVVPEPVVHRSKQMSGSRIPNKTQQNRAHDVTSPSTSLMPNSTIPGSTNAASFLELDPVLARLLSDVSSLDEYRSALRPQGN